MQLGYCCLYIKICNNIAVDPGCLCNLIPTERSDEESQDFSLTPFCFFISVVPFESRGTRQLAVGWGILLGVFTMAITNK